MDTSGWVACADAADPAHSQATAARDAWMESGGLLITSDYVADETLTFIRLRLGLQAAEAWWRQVDGSSRLRWERVTIPRLEKARAIFFRYRDKEFSFTDCTSFAIMRELKVVEVLTTDITLPRPDLRPCPKKTPVEGAVNSSIARWASETMALWDWFGGNSWPTSRSGTGRPDSVPCHTPGASRWAARVCPNPPR